jgi:hypothetical protein
MRVETRQKLESELARVYAQKPRLKMLSKNSISSKAISLIFLSVIVLSRQPFWHSVKVICSVEYIYCTTFFTIHPGNASSIASIFVG